MNRHFREDADYIVRTAIDAVLPEAAVARALSNVELTGRVVLLAVGKAAWRMAKAAYDELGPRVDSGMVITKYGHSQGPIGAFRIFEAGHPVSDENGFRATEAAIRMVQGLIDQDTVLFLLSGGGSALFEKPLISVDEYRDINRQLLASGADIVSVNTVRKRLSSVKGGRFAGYCGSARIEAVILSDVLGDRPDMIASGPVSPDLSTAEDALRIVRAYKLNLSEDALKCLSRPTGGATSNVHYQVTGSVSQLVHAAMRACSSLGYETRLLTDGMDIEASQAGRFLGAIARTHASSGRKIAFVAGGETVVHLNGGGKGGRNQEIALSAAACISGLDSAAVFSFSSDGTDGPTDAAGGYADGRTARLLEHTGCAVEDALRDNDSYNALAKTGGLLITGPTGTNVNDCSVILIDSDEEERK
ncbi:MAG: DUF4147 domain-containing protein [Clostridia bacterium]|nr:DUF4147 domain-containing protein [Clostridia bacterium]